MNKVQLIGYLGKDPLIRKFGNDNAVAVLRLATNIYYQPKEGDLVRTTQWHTVKFWGKQQIAKFCEYLIKGSHVLVEGYLLYDTYVDRNGVVRQVTEINAKNLVDLDR